MTDLVTRLAAARQSLLDDLSVHDAVAVLRSNRAATATIEDIFFCFRLILGREPRSDEIIGHMCNVDMDLASVVSIYLNSREFDGRNLLHVAPSDLQLCELYGYEIYAHADDVSVGRQVVTGQYEPEVAAIFRRFVKPGDTVVDIGANIGVFTMLAARLTGPSGCVFAFEPNPANLRLLEASRRKNGFDHVSVHGVAATRTNGIMALNAVSSNGSVGSPSGDLDTLLRSSIVSGVRLDDYLKLKRLDLVKVDIEGGEPEAMAGFRAMLKKYKPVVISEFAPAVLRQATDEYLDLFIGLGYDLGVIRLPGEIEDFGTDKAALIEAWRRTGVDHIDIVARSPD